MANEGFPEVMRTASVTKAAENLGRTQPAISNCIASLEEEIGYRLFERFKGRLHPVPEAHYLLNQAESILDRVGSLEATMRRVDSIPEEIRIACMPIFSEFFIPQLFTRFTNEHPETRFLLSGASSQLIHDLVASQQFDLGLAEVTSGSELVDAETFELECLCALPVSDRLAKKKIITPSDLDARPCATFLNDHFIPVSLQKSFTEAGADLNVQFQMQNGAAHYAIVESGLAFGILSPLSAWLYRHIRQGEGEIAFIPFRPAIKYQFAIMRPAHRRLSRLSNLFAEFLRKEIIGILHETSD